MNPSISAELRRLETALATRDGRAVDGGLAGLIADDFVEHGASGTVWDARATREAVTADGSSGVTLDGFVAHELAPGVVLVRYRTTGDRPAVRASVWVRRGDRWQIRFHQGTLLPR
jgi:ribonuclease HI